MQGCRNFLDSILSVGISVPHCLSRAARCEVEIPGVRELPSRWNNILLVICKHEASNRVAAR